MQLSGPIIGGIVLLIAVITLVALYFAGVFSGSGEPEAEKSETTKNQNTNPKKNDETVTSTTKTDQSNTKGKNNEDVTTKVKTDKDKKQKEEGKDDEKPKADQTPALKTQISEAVEAAKDVFAKNEKLFEDLKACQYDSAELLTWLNVNIHLIENLEDILKLLKIFHSMLELYHQQYLACKDDKSCEDKVATKYPAAQCALGTTFNRVLALRADLANWSTEEEVTFIQRLKTDIEKVIFWPGSSFCCP